MIRNKAYYVILILVFILTACDDDSNEMLLEKLQGDWLSISNEYGYISIKDTLIYCYHIFTDEEIPSFECLPDARYDMYMLSYNGLSNKYVPFHIQNDTLIIPYYNQRIYLKSVSDKYISTQDNEKGKLYPLFIKPEASRNSNLSIKSVEIRFVNIYNAADPGVRDWGIKFDDKMNCVLRVADTSGNRNKDSLKYSAGEYFTRLTPAAFQNIQSKFCNLPLTDIKNICAEEYYSSYSGQIVNSILLCDFEFEVKNSDKVNHLQFFVRGNWDMPGYLAAFIKSVYDIYNNVRFTKSEAVHNFATYTQEYEKIGAREPVYITPPLQSYYEAE